MVTYKFRIGDKLRYKGRSRGYSDLETGDIVTVSDRRDSIGDACYGFKEDKKYDAKAHWLHVHDNFELVKHKYNIGDLLACVNPDGYDTVEGEVVTVHSIGWDLELVYGFKEDRRNKKKAVWCDVEENFKKVSKSSRKVTKPSKDKPKKVDQYQVLADIFMGGQ